jgi:hypothetical protein
MENKVELGITLEQFKTLKKNAKRNGVEICYDKNTGEWYVNAGTLVGAIMREAGMDNEQGAEIFIKAQAAVITMAMLNELLENPESFLKDGN